MPQEAHALLRGSAGVPALDNPALRVRDGHDQRAKFRSHILIVAPSNGAVVRLVHMLPYHASINNSFDSS